MRWREHIKRFTTNAVYALECVCLVECLQGGHGVVVWVDGVETLKNSQGRCGGGEVPPCPAASDVASGINKKAVKN